MPDQSFTLRIESMAYGGRGVGRRADGKVVFVPLVIPGELVQASVVRDRKGYIEARLEDVIEAAPSRVDAPCALFAQCGGCDWQHISYDAQVSLKNDIVREQLTAKAAIPPHGLEEPVASPLKYGYRCHALLRCMQQDGSRFGFFRRQSNSIVPFERCFILNDRCADVLEGLRDALSQVRMRGLESLEVHAPGDDALVRACLVRPFRQKDLMILEDAYHSAGIHGLSCMTRTGRVREHVFGELSCTYELSLQAGTVRLSSGFGGFIQANMGINRSLVSHVLHCADGSGNVLDLYSGSGNFSIPLSLGAEQVTAVERSPTLAKNGEALARENGCENIRFMSRDVMQAVSELHEQGMHFDTIVLDPPREGAREVVCELPGLNADRIIYISCNPSTLARDLAMLAPAYEVASVRIFDMFPQTYHIETVAALTRKPHPAHAAAPCDGQ